MRQADTVLLVAEQSRSPRLSPAEEVVLSIHPSSARRLVLIHDIRSDVVSGTSEWLDRRDVFEHHHVSLSDGADIERLVRFLSGRALGFVAGGGGSLGSAHLGVYKALVQAGVHVDCFGGTSAGAAMMAGAALGADAEQIDRGTHKIFIESRAFRRPTLPRFALLDHKTFDRALRAEYGDVRIEDLWLPFFAVSTNLSTSQPFVHRRGKLWHAVRASGSIPGILPPFFNAEGDMLVDGAIMSNLPLEEMKKIKTGPNIVVSLSGRGSRRYDVAYDRIPGAAELAMAFLNPFSRANLPEMPSMLHVIAESMLAHRQKDLVFDDGDVLICPPLRTNISFMDWRHHAELFAETHRYMVGWIDDQFRESGSGMRAIFGATGRPVSS
jgi:NTE family protein